MLTFLNDLFTNYFTQKRICILKNTLLLVDVIGGNKIEIGKRKKLKIKEHRQKDREIEDIRIK